MSALLTLPAWRRTARPVPFDEVLACFREEHAVDRVHEFNTNGKTDRTLCALDARTRGWWRAHLSADEVLDVILPWHESEGGQFKLVPPTGLSVAQAVERLRPAAARFAEDSPLCWAKLQRVRDLPLSTMFLATRPPLTVDYERLATREGQIHLDGLHRMVSWALHGRLDGEMRLTAYVADVRRGLNAPDYGRGDT